MTLLLLLCFFSVATAEVEDSCKAHRKRLSFLVPDCNVSGGSKEEEERVGVVIEIRELGTPNDPPAIVAIIRKKQKL